MWTKGKLFLISLPNTTYPKLKVSINVNTDALRIEDVERVERIFEKLETLVQKVYEEWEEEYK